MSTLILISTPLETLMRFVPHPQAVKLRSLSNQSKVIFSIIKPLPAALAPFAHLKIRAIFSTWRVPLADTTACGLANVLSGSSLTGWSSRLENRVPPLPLHPIADHHHFPYIFFDSHNLHNEVNPHFQNLSDTSRFSA